MLMAGATCLLLAMRMPGEDSRQPIHATCTMMAVVLGFIGTLLTFVNRIDFSLWVFVVVGLLAYVAFVEAMTHLIANTREWLHRRRLRSTLVSGPVCLWHDDAQADGTTNMCSFCCQWFGLQCEG